MEKNSLNRMLFLLGALGSMLLVIEAAYYLIAFYLPLPDFATIFGWLNVCALIMIAFAIISIRRKTERLVPLLTIIFLFIQVVFNTLRLLNILRPLMISFITENFFLVTYWQPPSIPVTADWIIAWLDWILWLGAFLFLGYSVKVSQEDIGDFARLSGLIIMPWGVVQWIFRFFDYGLGPSILDIVVLTGMITIFLLIFSYFILMILV